MGKVRKEKEGGGMKKRKGKGIVNGRWKDGSKQGSAFYAFSGGFTQGIKKCYSHQPSEFPQGPAEDG